MIEKLTEFYKIEFYDSYVIMEANADIVVNSIIAEKTLKTVIDHFNGKNFVIISNRKSNYILQTDAYSSVSFKKVKGIAIVSKNVEVRKRAVLEQEKFHRSFAFFENLDDAKNWAENFFVTY